MLLFPIADVRFPPALTTPFWGQGHGHPRDLSQFETISLHGYLFIFLSLVWLNKAGEHLTHSAVVRAKREPRYRAQVEPKLHAFTSSPVHQRHQFHLHWQQRSCSREPLCAHRKPNFTSLPCFPAKINTISFKFISPGGLIPQRSLSTKYYYYPNRLSWVIFLFEKKCLEPNMSEGLEVTSKPAEK